MKTCIGQIGLVIMVAQVASTFVASLTFAQTTQLSFDLDRTHHLDSKSVDDRVWEFTTRGEDPWVLLESLKDRKISETNTTLAFEYFCPEGVSGLDIYFGPPITENQHVSPGALPRAESWLPFAVDLRIASNGNWTPANHQLRLDFWSSPGSHDSR